MWRMGWYAFCFVLRGDKGKADKTGIRKGRQLKGKAGKKISLMLIDQDKYVRESLKIFFDDSPVDLLIFKTAADGLNALKHQRADVVVADYFLPDTDGLTLLKQAKEIQPDALRILMATITSDELEQDIEKAGINRLIEKPLTVASLDTVINELAKTNLSNQGRR